MESPTWSVPDNGWKFNVFMINVSAGERVQLNHQPECTGKSGGLCRDLNPRFGDCSGDQTICKVTFILRRESLPTYQDSMEVQVYPETQSPAPIRPIKIGGLRSQLSPVLAYLSTDFTQMSGINLVFDQIAVGAGGKPTDITCSRPTDCTVTYPPGTKKGYLYFVAQPGQGENGLIPVVLQEAQGLGKVLYTPPEKPAPKTAEKAAAPEAVPPPKPKVPLSSVTD
jgi:hypothetical protein